MKCKLLYVYGKRTTYGRFLLKKGGNFYFHAGQRHKQHI
jgi:hypothetical protein